MKLTIRRALAATATGALAATGAIVLTPVASQAQAQADTPVMTKFGFSTVASGVQLKLQGADVRNVRAALVYQNCTRQANTPLKVATTPLATPDNPLINVSAVTSTSKTYKVGTKYGAIATSTIGDIAIGSADVGTITLKGLETSADAWHTPTGYGSKGALTWTKIGITLPGGTEIPAPLQDLLDAIDTQVVGNVISVLQQASAPIDIPGLGKIALAETWKQKGAHFAQADAHGLVIRLTADGNNTTIYLGQAHARIGGPAPTGTFRSNMQGMDLLALNSAVHLSRVGATNLPCEGTYGKTVSKTVPSAGVVAPLQIHLTGVKSTYSGNQTAQGVMTGVAKSEVAKIEIPLAQLVIENVMASVKVTRHPGQPVVSDVQTSIGSITINGESVAVPKPGAVLDLPNGLGTIEYRIVKRGKLGAQVKALRITIFGEQAVQAYFGWATNNVWYD